MGSSLSRKCKSRINEVAIVWGGESRTVARERRSREGRRSWEVTVVDYQKDMGEEV
jgi:hypothetical protein